MNIPAPWSISDHFCMGQLHWGDRAGPTSAGSTVRIQEPKDWPPTAQGWDGTADEKKCAWCSSFWTPDESLLATGLLYVYIIHIYIIYIYTCIYIVRRYNYILILMLWIIMLIIIQLNIIPLIIVIIIISIKVLYLDMIPFYDYIHMHLIVRSWGW